MGERADQMIVHYVAASFKLPVWGLPTPYLKQINATRSTVLTMEASMFNEFKLYTVCVLRCEVENLHKDRNFFFF